MKQLGVFIAIFLVFIVCAGYASSDVAPALQEQFWKACEDGKAQLVEDLLKKNNALANAPGIRGTFPLRGSILWEHVAVVEVLLAYGADVNQVSEDVGMTPLQTAVLLEHEEIVRILLDHLRIDVKKEVCFKRHTYTVWDYVRRCSSPEIVALFDRFKKS
jgi:hypothetical protein